MRARTGDGRFSDTLGVLEALDARRALVRRRDGSLASVDLGVVVAARTVPPAPPRRLHASTEEVDRAGAAAWPATEQLELGGWLLRASAGFTQRANCAIPLGESGLSWPDTVAAVLAFYRHRDLAPTVQVVLGSPEDTQLRDEGWVAGGPGGHVLVRVAALAEVRARLAAPDQVRGPGRSGLAQVEVQLSEELVPGWLELYRGRSPGPVERGVLAGPVPGGQRVLAHVRDPAGAGLLAVGRAAAVGGWLAVAALTVAPQVRNRGLGSAVLNALLGWGGGLGIGWVQLQVEADNEGANRLYSRLGFSTHHSIAWRRAPTTRARLADAQTSPR